MRKGFTSAALAVLAVWLPAVASAGGYAANPPTSYYVSAPVVAVQPIVSQHTLRQPVRQCSTVRYADDYAYRRNEGSQFVPSLLGGLVGGLIGNQFGGGNGKKALTIVGALAGSSIARDAARQRQRRDYPTEVCRTTYRSEVTEAVTAYDVTYEYAGRHFEKRMSEDPGDTVRVRVALSPSSAGSP
ncbi:MAG: glycine zipper 2TM domain-containing protein [Pseudomonadales bacterium]|jgi:uncharacterized protein YcfJ